MPRLDRWMLTTDHLVATLLCRRRPTGGGDARGIRRRWEAVAAECMVGEHRPGQRTPPLPELVTVDVTDLMISLVIEPPVTWRAEQYGLFASALARRWSGRHPVITPAPQDRMGRRRVRIEISMRELPAVEPGGGGGVPFPDPAPEGEGVAIGVDAMGRVHRIVLGPSGAAHALVAGTTRSGKTTVMRHIGRGYERVGWVVVAIDPKGEGDLDGIGTLPVAVTPDEITDRLRWLMRVREERAARKAGGVRHQHGVLVLVDEAASLLLGTGIGSEGQALVRGLVQMGGGTGVNVVLGVQQASAQALGGDKMGTFIRDNCMARLLVGPGQDVSVRMMLGERMLTPDHEDQMRGAGQGRALVSGLTREDVAGVHSIQIYAPDPGDDRPVLRVVDDRDLVRGLTVGEPVPEEDAGPAGVGGVAGRVVEYLHQHPGWVMRTTLVEAVGASGSSVREAVGRLASGDPPMVEVELRGEGRDRRAWVRAVTPPDAT